MKIEVELEYEKETRRTYRFKENKEPPVIGYLYVQKTAFEEEPPKKIKVTIEAI